MPVEEIRNQIAVDSGSALGVIKLIEERGNNLDCGKGLSYATAVSSIRTGSPG